jgi:YesN/AraC family two-component response regulator
MSVRNSLHVLVVDDNESIRRSLCQLLRSESNIDVICEAVDGADAVSKAREHSPDVVLLDVTMPNMDGLEAPEFSSKNFPPFRLLSSVSTILGEFGGRHWRLV